MDYEHRGTMKRESLNITTFTEGANMAPNVPRDLLVRRKPAPLRGTAPNIAKNVMETESASEITQHIEVWVKRLGASMFKVLSIPPIQKRLHIRFSRGTLGSLLIPRSGILKSTLTFDKEKF